MACRTPFRLLLTVLVLLALLLSSTPSPRLMAGRQSQATPMAWPRKPCAAGRSATADINPPAPVIALSAAAGTAAGTVELTWIAPGDDGTTGTASGYIVRYNATPITEDNWNASTDVAGVPSPSPAGSPESMTVSGLMPRRQYHFALKSQDEVPNTSGVSNSPRAMAQGWPNATFLPLTLSAAASLPPVIPSSTEVLTETTTQYLSSISGDGSVFTFTQSTPALDGLVPGEVIVGDVSENAPHGFLRKVTSTSSSGGLVVLETEEATLEDAIESGEAHLSHVLTPDQAQKVTQLSGVTLATAPQSGDDFYLIIEEVVLYDDDGDPGTEDDQITADGSILLQPGFDLRLKVRDRHLEELSFTTSAVETADLEITSGVELPSVEEEVEVARYSLSAVTIWVGAVPVVVLPVLRVNVGVDGRVHVGVTTGVVQHAALRAGVKYADETWRPVTGFSNHFQYHPPELSADLDVKGYVIAQLSLLLYGVAGPYAEIDAYLKLEADVSATSQWVLYGGLDAPIGVNVEVLGRLLADYETLAIGYRLALAHAYSTNPPDTPSSPSPAAGATDQDVSEDLRWVGGDPDGDTVTYDVYFEANDPTPDDLICDDVGTTACDPGALSYLTQYFWKVIARDEHGATTEGPVWQFITLSNPDALLQERFEDPSPYWEPFLNYWRLNHLQWYIAWGEGVSGSAALEHTYWRGGTEAHDALYMYLDPSSEEWTNYRYEAMVRLPDSDQIQGLWFRGFYTYSGVVLKHVEGYLLVWQAGLDTGNVFLFRFRDEGPNANSLADPEPLAVGDYPIALGAWYHMAIEARGSNLKAYVDDHLVIEYDDATWPTGTVGMYSYMVSDGAWDDILVMPLP
jgi:hypothetical protein